MTDDDTAVLEPELEQRLRRGLLLLAEQTPPPRNRRAWLAAAAVVVLALVGVGLGLRFTGDGTSPGRHQAGPAAPSVGGNPPTNSGPSVIGQGVTYDLPRLVDESPRIVIGTVMRVTHGEASDASGGLPYVLADISIDRTLKGPNTAQLVAFDYDYGTGVTSDAAQGATFNVGERVLLFVSSSEGTVHADLDRPHWQVTGGAAGEYRMRGDVPDAPFTLSDVENEVDA